ncbi:MAG: alpha/beta hydrolase [Bacteroidota bacterium]|jgi:acetyl esterase/lipase
MKYIFLFVFFALLSSCQSDLNLIIPETAPGSIMGSNMTFEERLDLSYGKNILQNYDLYLPSTRNERNPVIVLLHPGAWRIGDKMAVNSIVKGFISKRVNCAIVNANYRLTSSVGITYVQQVEDINTLLVKLKNDAKSLGISSDFFLVGLSAGGHLAMLYANSPLGDKLAKGVAGIVPPVNLASEAFRNGSIGSDVQKLVGKTFAAQPDEYYRASPIFQYNSTSPPTIVFFGGKDETVPVEQSDVCKKLLQITRSKSDYHFYPNQTHDWNIWDETIDKIVTFVEKNL